MLIQCAGAWVGKYENTVDGWEMKCVSSINPIISGLGFTFYIFKYAIEFSGTRVTRFVTSPFFEESYFQ